MYYSARSSAWHQNNCYNCIVTVVLYNGATRYQSDQQHGDSSTSSSRQLVSGGATGVFVSIIIAATYLYSQFSCFQIYKVLKPCFSERNVASVFCRESLFVSSFNSTHTNKQTNKQTKQTNQQSTVPSAQVGEGNKGCQGNILHNS